MPHCNRGRELKVGDRVMIECIVESLQAGEDYCNVTVRTVRPMPPYETGTTVTLNTRQTESIE
jgi:hypothetical protein